MIDEKATYRDRHRMTETEIISGMCHGSSGRLQDERKKQADSYRTGRALSGHVKDAHKGIEDPNCNACKELRVRCGL